MAQCIDSAFLQYTVGKTLQRSASVHLLFAFEYVIQASVVLSTAIKYCLGAIDNYFEGRWESKVFLSPASLLLSVTPRRVSRILPESHDTGRFAICNSCLEAYASKQHMRAAHARSYACKQLSHMITSRACAHASLAPACGNPAPGVPNPEAACFEAQQLPPSCAGGR